MNTDLQLSELSKKVGHHRTEITSYILLNIYIKPFHIQLLYSRSLYIYIHIYNKYICDIIYIYYMDL